MAMTPLQRKAALKSAVTLKQMTLGEAARFLGISYNHLMLVMAGERIASAGLKDRLASLLDVPATELFEPERK
jgi:transcriptional regulator with XRE-family HTH domain